MNDDERMVAAAETMAARFFGKEVVLEHTGETLVMTPDDLVMTEAQFSAVHDLRDRSYACITDDDGWWPVEDGDVILARRVDRDVVFIGHYDGGVSAYYVIGPDRR